MKNLQSHCLIAIHKISNYKEKGCNMESCCSLKTLENLSVYDNELTLLLHIVPTEY